MHSTFDQEFFPTPEHIARKMLAPWTAGQLAEMTILEPSAGKGDLLNVIKERISSWHRTPKNKLYAIEQNHELKAILRDKGFRVVGSDFLQYRPEVQLDLIVMNPPFSNADEHILHAWNILEEGEIVALCNRETIDNPHSERRKLLERVIYDNSGTVENLGKCFLSAERPTAVDTVMVRLKKVSTKAHTDFHFSTENIDFKAETTPQELANLDMLQNICDDYKRAMALFADGMESIDRASTIVSSICTEYACKPFEIAGQGGRLRDRQEEFNTQIKTGIWEKIIRRLGIEKYMTSQLRSDFQTYLAQQSQMAITKENILEFLDMIMSNRGNIMDNAVVEVFDMFTRYHKENRLHIEGWKTNDKFKVNKRVILPNFVSFGKWSTGFRVEYGMGRKYDDIDKAMSYLAGKNWEKVDTIEQALERSFRLGESGVAESEFFKLRYYKKGTGHLEFKDDWLWREFNMRACSGKNWLPEAEKREWQAEKSKSTSLTIC